MGAGGSRICGPSQPAITNAHMAVKHATRDFASPDIGTEEKAQKKYQFDGAPDVATTIEGQLIAGNLQEIWSFFVQDLENKSELPRDMANRIILHVVSHLKKRSIEDMPDMPVLSAGEEQVDINEHFQDKDADLAKAILEDFENSSGGSNLQFNDFMSLAGQSFIDLLSKHDAIIPDLENVSLRRFHSVREFDKVSRTRRESVSAPKTPRSHQRGSSTTALYLEEVGLAVNKPVN